MTVNASDRAARRASVNAARRSAIQQQAPEEFDAPVGAAPEAPVAAPEPVSIPRTRLPRQDTPSQAVPEPATEQPAPTRPVAPRAQQAQGGAIMLPQRDLTRELGAGDLIIPKLKLAQGLSAVAKLYGTSRGKEGIPAGVWYYTTGSRDLGETVYFIPCDMRKSRSMFEQGAGVVCRSFDLLRGEGDPGGLCEGTAEEMATLPENDRGCPLRLWTRTAAGNTPPPCGMTYNYTGLIVVDPENPATTEVLQAMLQFRSTSINAAKGINTSVMTFGGGEWANTVIELRVESRKTSKGDYFVPVADFYDTVDGAGWDRIARRSRAFAKQMGAADLRSTIETDPDAAN